MKVIQNLFLIFFFFFITKDLFAGLGNTTWGPGGIKRDVEVNEIEVDTTDKEEEKIRGTPKFIDEMNEANRYFQMWTYITETKTSRLYFEGNKLVRIEK